MVLPYAVDGDHHTGQLDTTPGRLPEQVIGDAPGHGEMQQLAAVEPAAAATAGLSTTSVCGPAAPRAVTAPSTFLTSTSKPSACLPVVHHRG
jgi:hypothetical protein